MRSLLISMCGASLVLAQSLVPPAAGAQSVAPIALSRGTTTGSMICSAAIGTSCGTTKADYVGLHNSNAVSELLVGEAQAQSTLRMNPGQRLDKGQKIEVAGKGSLTMQTDGNLVLYDAANQPRWASGTYGKPVTHVIMQPDGNLVIYNNTTPVWASGTGNVGASGGYFEIDLSTWTGAIHSADGSVAKVLFQQGPTVQLNLPPVQTNPQQATVQVTQQQTIAQGPITTATGTLKFPRQQGWEQQVLSALGMPGVPAAYASMTPLQQAIGSMALDATEAYFPAKKLNLQPQEAIDK